MKKMAIVTAVLAAALISLPAWAASTTIVGSPHDLSPSGPGHGALGINEICLPCHVPHNSMNGAQGYLWNHALPTTTSWGAGHGGPITLYGKSLLCMGCHDGVTSVGSIGSFNALNGSTTLGATATPIQSLSWARTATWGGTTYFVNDLGTDLSSIHPVGVVYSNTTGTATSMNSASYPKGHIGSLRLEVGATAGVNDTVGCTTCHDPHNDQYGAFLAISNTSSALCLTCHVK